MLQGVFEVGLSDALNDDDVALHHELAHAATWAFMGQGIGRLRLRRAGDGLLEPSVRCGQASQAQVATPAFIDAVAERLLAGELGARRYLGMRTDRVSIPQAPRHATATLDEVRSLCRGRDDDIKKVLDLAEGRVDWLSWLAARVASSAERVESLWKPIDRVATVLTAMVPTKRGAEVRVFGTDLIAMLAREGIAAPVELVAPEDRGTIRVRMRRRWRQLYGRSWRIDA